MTQKPESDNKIYNSEINVVDEVEDFLSCDPYWPDAPELSDDYTATMQRVAERFSSEEEQ